MAVTETIWLEREGFKVIHVPSGEEAIETVKTGDCTIDLILMDIELRGGIDGIAAAKEILKYRDIPIIFLSSHTEKNIVEKTEEVTSYGYVVKDSMENVLITSIKMAFRLHKTQTELKEKEKALELTQKHLRESQQTARIGSYEVDLIEDTWTSSEELIHLSGLSEDSERKRDSWYNIIHPDFRDDVRKYFDRVIADKIPFNKEYKIIRPSDGRELWVWETGELVFDSKNKPVKLKGVVQDISYRKEIEEELLQTESLYRVLLDDSSDPIFAIDIEGTYLYVNKAFAKGVKREQNEIISKKIWDVFSPEEAEKRFAAVRVVTATGKPKVIEVLVDALGVNHYFMTTVQPLVSKYMKNKAVLCISKDITERKVAELKLAEKEKQYQNLFLQSPGALVLEDLDGNIIDINPAFCKMTGFTREETIGRNVKMFVAPENREFIPENIQKVISAGHLEQEVLNYKRDGTLYWVALNESVIKLPDGRDGIISLANDITLRKEADAQIEKYTRELEIINSAKDKFFSIISHDLRGPFLAFLGLSKMLSEEIDTLEPAKIKRVSNILHTSLQRQYELLNDLLDWSRLQADKFGFTLQKLSILAQAEKVVEAVQLMASQKGVQLLLDVDEVLKINADMNMLRLVLRNLIMNGIKFTNTGGEVKISAHKNESGIEIIIEDNGVGISKANLQKLFKIDTRFSTEGTLKEKGTGLGLILCKEIVEKHNGTIDVISEEGKGTKFILSFPGAL